MCMKGVGVAYEEDWETSSGLALDGADVTVSNVEFGFNANMGAGITCANFTFVDDNTEEELEQSFSCGKNFEANRDGSELTGNGKINKNSNFGLLIESIKEVIDNPGDVIGNPKVAANWVGTKWSMGTVEREKMNPTTGEKKIGSSFVVTAFNGKAGDESGSGAAKSAATKKASGSAKSAKPAASSNTGAPEGVDDVLWNTLTTLAGEHEEHEDFVNAALELDDVSTNKAAQKAVMSTKAGSVWAAKAT